MPEPGTPDNPARLRAPEVDPSTERRRRLGEVHIQVGVPDATREKFRALCERHDTDMSHALRHWIAEALAGRLKPG